MHPARRTPDERTAFRATIAIGFIVVFSLTAIVLVGSWRDPTVYRLAFSAERQTPDAPRPTVRALAIELQVNPLAVMTANDRVHVTKVVAARPATTSARMPVRDEERVRPKDLTRIEGVLRDWLSQVRIVEFSFEAMFDAIQQQLEDGRLKYATDAIDQ